MTVPNNQVKVEKTELYTHPKILELFKMFNIVYPTIRVEGK